jgi:hypothetical protein
MREHAVGLVVLLESRHSAFRDVSRLLSSFGLGGQHAIHSRHRHQPKSGRPPPRNNIGNLPMAVVASSISLAPGFGPIKLGSLTNLAHQQNMSVRLFRKRALGKPQTPVTLAVSRRSVSRHLRPTLLHSARGLAG